MGEEESKDVVSDFEDGERRPGAKKCRWLLEAGKSQEMDFPSGASEGASPADPLTLAQGAR